MIIGLRAGSFVDLNWNWKLLQLESPCFSLSAFPAVIVLHCFPVLLRRRAAQMLANKSKVAPSGLAARQEKARSSGSFGETKAAEAGTQGSGERQKVKAVVNLKPAVVPLTRYFNKKVQLNLSLQQEEGIGNIATLNLNASVPNNVGESESPGTYKEVPQMVGGRTTPSSVNAVAVDLANLEGNGCGGLEANSDVASKGAQALTQVPNLTPDGVHDLTQASVVGKPQRGEQTLAEGKLTPKFGTDKDLGDTFFLCRINLVGLATKT
ncbi:hypothetical protein NDU88_006067 [Pleurodeles waltl]|uniref:Uncharacterized protein n=1 Tax=Pleurodeles waltl TaxID=8319 RepID=A0AAV7UJZ2_PLEWA|nr:hypothetical protein NDU88_006067 [Pleurodeles waltl]